MSLILNRKIILLTFNPLLIGGDGGAFDAHVVFKDGVCRVKGHLVISGISVGQPQVIVQAFQLQSFQLLESLVLVM